MRDWLRHVIEITAEGRSGVATLTRRTMGNEARALGDAHCDMSFATKIIVQQKLMEITGSTEERKQVVPPP